MEEKMRRLNIGCGNCFHPDWENIDLRPYSPHVKHIDIRKGLPYPRETFDAVYSSHLLEHLSQDQARSLLQEIKRVLKKDGIIRIVVPDLEAIARIYLEKLDASINNIPGAEADYDWMLMELLDQTTRTSRGGEMLKFLLKKDLNNKDFIRSRIGQEAEQYWIAESQDPQERPGRKKKNPIKTLGKGLLKWLLGKEAAAAFEEVLLRNSGEVHRWMYDRFFLKRLLERSGFEDVRVCRADESRIYNFNSYGLDIQDGKIRKPDSLFMEGKKEED
jgi:predicted SAM-dependent methyltransferase